MYALWVNRQLKEVSSDLDYLKRVASAWRKGGMVPVIMDRKGRVY
jgi:hypothetical protein